jgi:hypothetical protein
MAKKSSTEKVETPTPETNEKEVSQQETNLESSEQTNPTPEAEAQAEVDKETQQPTPTETPAKPKPLTMTALKAEVDELRQIVQALTTQMADVQSLLALKRKPTNNAKVQIKDKLTGKTYKSKNNCYQSLLKAGELKDLVEKGIFGDNPEKNNFGWFALQRQFPDRFEEVKSDEA